MAAITDLATVAGSALTSADYLVANDSGTDKKVAATDYAAVGKTNTFAAAQVITLSSGKNLSAQYSGSERAYIQANTGYGSLVAVGADNGAGQAAELVATKNTNASTPAPGMMVCQAADGVYSFLYPDNSDVWRTKVTAATNATIAAGTVVGDQTSMAAAKHISDELSPLSDVLTRIAAGADAVRRFVYRNGRYNGEQFEGVVTDYAPDYGKDATDDAPQGQALNEINIMGDLLRAVAYLTERVRELERR